MTEMISKNERVINHASRAGSLNENFVANKFNHIFELYGFECPALLSSSSVSRSHTEMRARFENRRENLTFCARNATYRLNSCDLT